ncbi:MAG: C45 family peptidase [Arthrobacter sp.]|jgi:isopenicillin-N N-acyltransferase-like protein|nr:C45 family peptidase [Arthrobacter sp.]
MQLHRFSDESAGPEARGTALGTAHAEALAASSLLYRDFFRHLGLSDGRVEALAASAHEALSSWRPLLARELEAVAAASGQPLWHVQAVNARTEILAAAGAAGHECSTLTTVLDGEAVTMQTWDWHADLVPDGLLHSWFSDTGLGVKSFTEFGAQAKIGVNSAKVGLHFNILSHRSDTGENGVPVHSIARAVLDEAESLESAIQIASSAPASASSSLTVLEASDTPRVAALEISPIGTAVVPSADGTLLHTNHFLDPTLASGDTIPEESRTLQRFAALQDGLSRLAATGSALADDVAAALMGPSGTDSVLCFQPDADAPPENRWDTLLTIALAPRTFRLHASASTPSSPTFSAF